MKTPSTNHLVILNSRAGGGSCGRHAAQWLDRLRQSGLNIDVFETRAHGDARGYAREKFSEGHRDFISFGGDGTAFEIVNGLLERPAAGDRPRLGIMPLGTGNSFLREFSDRGAENTIEALQAKRHQTCDVCRVTHATGVLHYLNIFGIGFVADVAARRSRQFSSLGELGYTLSTLVQLVGLRSTRGLRTANDELEIMSFRWRDCHPPS
jgi:diacylglycerol kinase family enzyme